MSEAPVLKRTMMQASRIGCRLLRNNRGQFYTMDGVKVLIKLVRARDWGALAAAINRLRQVRAGVEAPGSSDLLGIYTMTITQEMVGKEIGVALVVETKEPNWKKPEDDHEREQENFIKQTIRRGGIGFFLTNHEDLQKKIEECIKKWLDAKKPNV